MATPSLKDFYFFLMLWGDPLPIYCAVDETGQVHNIAFSDPAIPASLLRAYISIRRHDRDNKPRIHDARLVKTKVSEKNGTCDFTIEFADMYLPLEEIAFAAASECYQQNLEKINAHDPEVIKNALKSVYAAA